VRCGPEAAHKACRSGLLGAPSCGFGLRFVSRGLWAELCGCRLGGAAVPDHTKLRGDSKSSAQIKNKWGGKCDHTSIAACFRMADCFAACEHLAVAKQSETDPMSCLF
jgi:hypothetical protein